MTNEKPKRAFHGAQCRSYPDCTGGCGIGCTHDVEAARPAPDAEIVAAPELTCDFTKALPGGVLDDSTFSEIETALDRADAPSTEAGRWLTLPERIAALAKAKGGSRT